MSTTVEPTAPKEITWSARRINRLADGLGAADYLEIGVNRGATFHDVALANRIAVDPKFLFDTAEFANPRTQFFEVTSDAYFEQLACHATFDICFLDGLHTFEQTLRDLNNAVAHSHRHTVWLIDDTRPSDVFSTLREQKRAMSFRRMTTESRSGDWHGDVFKLVYYIHDFMPGLNYRTLVGSGNPQTLVWRSDRGPRAPRFDNLEIISRMTYFDLHDHLDILRECGEDEALQLCIDDVLARPAAPV